MLFHKKAFIITPPSQTLFVTENFYPSNIALKNNRLKVINILDVDLDFFLNDQFTSFNKPKGRLNDKFFIPWKPEGVINYLENNCGLSKNKKIKGKTFTHHNEVFYFLRELQNENDLNLLFSIDHLDAHADLGLGDTSYEYIQTELILEPVQNRYNPKEGGRDGLSEGNFLAFAIACRWIKDITYINKREWSDDLAQYLFKNFDTNTNLIELKTLNKAYIHQMIFGNPNVKVPNYSTSEPLVPFIKIDSTNFISSKKYDYVLLTQSPEYTPMTSDALIPIIEDYMDKI